jgi:tetratricopeptide (TPR) repeat protein
MCPGWCRAEVPAAAYDQKADSLLEKLNEPLPDSHKLDILTALCLEYLRPDPEKSIRYGEQALQHAEANQLDPAAILYWYLANAYDRMENLTMALGNQKLAVEKMDQQDSVTYFKVCDYLAYLYLKNGDFFKSVEQYEDNLHKAEEQQMAFGIARSHAGLANAYQAIGNKEKEAFHLNEFINNAGGDIHTRDISLVEFRLGDYLLDDFQYEISLNHFIKALETAVELNDTSWMASILNRIAWNYYLLKQADSSLLYYERSLSYALSMDDKPLIANAYGNMGNIYRDNKVAWKALEFYEKSFVLSRQTGDYFNLSWVSKEISDLHAANGNYKSAYEAHKQYIVFEDSLREEQYQERLLEARTRYEAEKTKSDLEMVRLQLKNNRYYTYGLAGSIIAVLIIALLLVIQNRLKTRQRLESMNHTISEITQRNLRQQMNPHFIFNTLNSIQYYVFQNDKMASNTYLSKFALLMRKTLDNSHYTSIPIKEEVEALELYLELESLRFKEKFTWKITIDDEIDTLLYKIPTLLIQPFVENSICHGLMHKDNGKGKILIEMALENDHIRCTVDDNGIGRDKAMEIKNNKNKEHHSLGTSITESRLKLISSIYGKKMNILYTDKKDESGQPTGTQVVINIPIIT